MDTVPSQDSPKHILNILNDDCIQSILHQITYPQDFLCAAETCTRFQANAKECFRSKYKRIGIAPNSPDLRIKHNNTFYIPYEHVNRFLRIFANFIDSIIFQGPIKKQSEISYKEFLEMTAHFCGRVLKKLEIVFCGTLDFNKLQTFSALEELKLHNTKVWNIKNSSKLKKLALSSRVFEYDRKRPLNDWMNQKFPHLEELVIGQSNNIKRPMLVNFLTLNPQLKTLEMHWCHSLTSSVLRNIGSRVPNLEKLVIDFPSRMTSRVGSVSLEENILHISELRKLRSLHIFGDVLSTNVLVDTILENNIPIDDFELISYDGNNAGTLHCILELKTLKKLSLGHVSEKLFIEIVKQMPNLKELTVSRCTDISGWSIKKALEYGKSLSLLVVETKFIYSSKGDFKIESDDYYSILALARGRVKIVIDGTYCTTDVPYDVLNANSQWIKINSSELKRLAI